MEIWKSWPAATLLGALVISTAGVLSETSPESTATQVLPFWKPSLVVSGLSPQSLESGASPSPVAGSLAWAPPAGSLRRRDDRRRHLAVGTATRATCAGIATRTTWGSGPCEKPCDIWQPVGAGRERPYCRPRGWSNRGQSLTHPISPRDLYQLPIYV